MLSVIRTGFFMTTLLLLVACNKSDMSDLKAFIAEVKSRPPVGVSPAPVPKNVESYLYVAGDRRDPFAPQAGFEETEETAADTGIQPDSNRQKEELENYALNSLLMVGTLEQGNTRWGLVKTPDDVVHRVASGHYMGLNHGRIIGISENQISLVELIQIGEGFQEQEALLSLDGATLSGETDAK